MSIVSVFLLLLYFVCRRLARVNDEQILKNNRRMRREEALRLARIYLAPYTDIWGNLKLSNKFCSLKLCADGTTIFGNELGEPYRQFKIIATKVHDWQDLWDMFCKSFHHNTTYDGLVKNCALFRTTIRETMKETSVSVDPVLVLLCLKNLSKNAKRLADLSQLMMFFCFCILETTCKNN